MPDYTDFYKTIQDGLIERLRYALRDDFLTNNLTEKVSTNESNIQRGADHYIVVKPGSHTSIEGLSFNSKEVQTVDWILRCELFVRFIEKDEQWARFSAFRSAFEWHVIKNRFLGNVTIGGQAIAEVPHVDKVMSTTPAGEAEYYRFNPDAVVPHFMTQPQNVVVRQRVRYA
jgi:hypothetical protein